MPASQWTDERLQRLFDRYNRVYWKNRIRRYAVLNRRLEKRAGLCERSRRRITIDVKQHPSDASVRATLLHEMAHAADRRRQRLAHGIGFWAEMESLLKKRAPIRVDRNEMPGFRVQSASIPPKFRLCRKAVEKIERKNDRQVPKGVVPQEVMEPEIVGRFEEAGFAGMTWKDTRLLVGSEFGLLNVGGKPINARALFIIGKGRAVHREALSMRDENQKFTAAPSNARTPLFLASNRAVESFIKGCALPLLGVVGETTVIFGTGTLFCFERRYFLVTAAHVFTDIPAGTLRFPIKPRSLTLTEPGEVTVLRSPDAIDVAILELHDPLVIERLATGWTVLTFENVAAVKYPRGMFLVAGYPQQEPKDSRWPRMPLLIGASGSRRRVRNSEYPFDPESDLLLDWNGTAVDVATGKQVKSPRLRGMSGASVWEMKPLPEGKVWAPQHQLRVVAIQSGALHGEYIRAKKWLLLWSAIRELSPSAAAKVRRSITRHHQTGR